MELFLEKLDQIIIEKKNLYNCLNLVHENRDLFQDSVSNTIMKHYNKNTTDVYKKILIYESNMTNIYVILWFPNAISPIHNHTEFGCILLPMTECFLKEEIFTNDNQLIKTNVVRDISYIHNSIGKHRISASNFCATLHIYSPKQSINQ